MRSGDSIGLTASPLSVCYAGPMLRPGLLLGFGGTDEAALEAATATLGAVLWSLLRAR